MVHAIKKFFNLLVYLCESKIPRVSLGIYYITSLFLIMYEYNEIKNMCYCVEDKTCLYSVVFFFLHSLLIFIFKVYMESPECVAKR